MAIQPIDLQTLFTQMDKVAKTQNAMREGFAVQQEMQGAQLQRKTDERIQSVNEANNTGDGAEKVKDKEKGAKEHGAKGKKKESQEEALGNEKPQASQIRPVYSDPCLGRNIDISL